MGEGPAGAGRSPLLPACRLGGPVPVAAALAGATILTWIVTLSRMRGMDAGPGTDLGDLGWFVGVWVTMMAAMMLPSVAPMALLFSRVSGERRRRGQAFVPTWVFLSGYLMAWTTYGLGAYAVVTVVRAAHLAAFAWNAQGPLIAGGAIVAAGLYQLTPLKRVCLRHCRSPLHYVLGSWRSGTVGALRMGVEHGAYCVGCCWGLMVILFAIGVMSVIWMLVVAGLIFAEKVLPFGHRLTPVFAAAFIGVGIWVAAAPASFPGFSKLAAAFLAGWPGISLLPR